MEQKSPRLGDNEARAGVSLGDAFSPTPNRPKRPILTAPLAARLRLEAIRWAMALGGAV
jgi:hypothetical protein